MLLPGGIGGEESVAGITEMRRVDMSYGFAVTALRYSAPKALVGEKELISSLERATRVAACEGVSLLALWKKSC